MYKEPTFDFLEENVSLDGGQSFIQVEFCFRVEDLFVLDVATFVQEDKPVLGAVAILQIIKSARISMKDHN
jgi:hypothetical protein